jgi:hypothetical protein
MFRGVVKLDFVENSSGFSRQKSFVKPTFSRLFRSRNNISEKLRRETAKLDPAYL